ncbi:MAG: hypothetical protein ACYCOU_20890 [Sulfobacillus sp.]
MNYVFPLSVDLSGLQFKSGINISNDITFVPVRFRGRDLIVQTPRLHVPWGIDEHYAALSLEDLDIDARQKEFRNFIGSLESKVAEKYPGYRIKPTLRQKESWSPYFYAKVLSDKNTSTMKELPKIGTQRGGPSDSKTEFFGIDRKPASPSDMLPRSQIMALIQLSGLVIKQQELSFAWHLHQVKLVVPVNRFDGCAIIEEERAPPVPIDTMFADFLRQNRSSVLRALDCHSQEIQRPRKIHNAPAAPKSPKLTESPIRDLRPKFIVDANMLLAGRKALKTVTNAAPKPRSGSAGQSDNLRPTFGIDAGMLSKQLTKLRPVIASEGTD